jgi:hypothetical protein
MMKSGAGYDFATEPEAGHDFEIFNWQLISDGVPKSKAEG